MPEDVLHLSALARSPLLDSSGDRLGRVDDVIVRLDTGDALPPVTGLKARIGGREMFVPADRLARLEPHAARTSTTELNLAQFERRPGEVLLRRDVLGRSLINVTTARLVTAREVELVFTDGSWRVAGIDPSLGAGMRRFLPWRTRRHEGDRSQPHEGEHSQFIPWTETEAFVGHVPTSRLRLASRRLARLHPAQIADLVEAASHDEGEEILQAVGQDKELEADVFEELDDEHQVEFLRQRSDEEVAGVLARMASDDAADLLLEIDQDRRIPILNLLPAAKQLKIRLLLGYNPSTAGGLMNPDFPSLAADATVGEALARVRASELAPSQLLTLWVIDAGGHLLGGVLSSELVRASEDAPVSSLIETAVPTVAPETELAEVARLMADFNLVAIPVVDGDEYPIGVVAVDDVVERLLPDQWRRRAGLARG
ncbi:MAG TPA: CBS domain-containing protein [Solirubrobacteraceae bacterium]|nr:CBS domain-containing protein [Solirubrobacteraceae bacterium]